MKDFSFRPLARLIGSYTWSASSVASPYKAFPAPREVIGIYTRMKDSWKQMNQFPSPLEVDR